MLNRIGCLLLTCIFIYACSSSVKDKTLANHMQEAKMNSFCVDFPSDIKEKLSIGDNERRIIYLLNGECSICISDFLIFLEHYSKHNITDSVLTVCMEARDNILVEYCRKKAEISLPNKHRYAFDLDCKISNKLMNISANSNLLVVQNDSIIFHCNMQSYQRDADDGEVRLIRYDED
ncbi:MAG: hypothetical protein K6G73_00865 [Marinilabiliaceae bacterium]|nr:hypothetical protein [Marinilabiliaceae bacterium]